MRCLVADGSSTTRSIIRNTLRGLGAREITEAADLQQAMAAAAQPFDLVVLDRELSPEADPGWIRSIKERTCPSGKIVIVARRATRADVEAARAMGACAFLLKPLRPDLLRLRFATMMGRADTPDGGQAGSEAAAA